MGRIDESEACGGIQMLKIIALLRMVPDVVEELEVAAGGKGLETEFLRMIVSEPDEHTLEQGLLLKEKYGGTVTAVALEGGDVDEVLFTALAKGADRVVKVVGELPRRNGATVAAVVRSVLKDIAGDLSADTLILTGSQAIDDVESEPAGFLSELLGLPYMNMVSGIELAEDGRVRVLREFAGGVRGVSTISLPAVIGVQSAEKPPRYVPVAKVRSVMKTAKIETVDWAAPEMAPP